MSLKPLLQIKNLCKTYFGEGDSASENTVKALDGVDLNIYQGEYIAIVGPSGSGKSTLMQILGLLDKATSGDYFLNGKEIASLDDEALAEMRSQEIGFIFQFFNLLPRTSCVDNVSLPMLYSGQSDAKLKSIKLLTKFGLKDRLDHSPHQLSGGQQQRVAIARSLANNPKILFADEPTGNINTEHTNEVLQLLDELNASGVTIILVTHEDEVAQRAKRVITIRDGKIESDKQNNTNKTMEDPRLKNSSTEVAVKQELKIKQSAHEKQIFSKKQNCRKESYSSLFKENFKMAYVALSLNKIRTILATLGVIIGISSVVSMIAIGEGAQKAISKQLNALGTNLLSVRPIPRKKKTGGGSYYRKFTKSDYFNLKKMVKKNTSLKNIDAKVYGSIDVAKNSENITTKIIGAFPVNESMESNKLVVGRFYSEEENKRKARVALIGQTVLSKLYKNGENPLGSRIKINKMEFKVIGVLPAKGATTFRDRDDVILVPIYTAMYRVLGKKRFSNLIVEVNNPEVVEDSISVLSSALRKQRNIPTHLENDFEIRNMNQIQKVYKNTTGIISSMLAAIAAISLLVGGIGIMNVMLVAVKERTREVGLRKALGAKKKSIMIQFLIEAMLIGLIGGAIGICGGYLLSYSASFFFEWPSLVPITAVLLAFFFSLAVGVLFGLWPAKQASDLSPIEALRYE